MKHLLILISFVIFYTNTFSQEENKTQDFTIEKIIPTTSVKQQGRTGTCWSFATVSFLESEIIHIGKKDTALSEMFNVYYAYLAKAQRYIRMHGKTNFSQGGQAHDVINILRNYGAVPDEIYKGLNYGFEIHNHDELESVLGAMLDGVLVNKSKHLSTAWQPAFESVLKTYLGEIPQKFVYNKTEYTPQSYAKSLGLNPDDYIEITSFNHIPFYEKSILEVPDNWSYSEYYNVPIEDLIRIMDNAIANGYSIAWDGDVSDKYFNKKTGVAIVPNIKQDEEDDEKMILTISEKNITQELRQETFNNFTTTDDHLMHIVGYAKDVAGKRYFITKNSWGTKYKLQGYWYMSDAYVKLKTIAILINKNAIPKDIAKKLKL